MKRVVRVLAILVAAWLILCLLGLIPVNNRFVNTPDGIAVTIISSSVHSDIVMPVNGAGWDWRERIPATSFGGDTSQATHVSIGWGDCGFFIETPTWSDMNLITAARALFWPTDTCMHVAMTDESGLENVGVRIWLSEEQYRQLAAAINDSFEIGADGGWMPIGGASYGAHDAFFSAHGRYHLLNTCNSWVGNMLRRSGVRVGWFTPLPKTVFLWLPASEP